MWDISSVGQSPRLITGLSKVQALDDPPFEQIVEDLEDNYCYTVMTLDTYTGMVCYTIYKVKNGGNGYEKKSEN